MSSTGQILSTCAVLQDTSAQAQFRRARSGNEDQGAPAVLKSLLESVLFGQKYVYIIDQARGQDGWILAEFSFCVFMDRDEVEVHKNAKRERG